MDNEASCQITGKRYFPVQETQGHHRLEEGTSNSRKDLNATLNP